MFKINSIENRSSTYTRLCVSASAEGLALHGASMCLTRDSQRDLQKADTSESKWWDMCQRHSPASSPGAEVLVSLPTELGPPAFSQTPVNYEGCVETTLLTLDWVKLSLYRLKFRQTRKWTLLFNEYYQREMPKVSGQTLAWKIKVLGFTALVG